MKAKTTSSPNIGVIITVIFLILALLGIVSLFVVNGAASTSPTVTANPRGSLSISPENQNLGDISMRNGVKELTYEVVNDGKEDITINGLETSCMCTTAAFRSTDGQVSPKYGMPGMGVNPPPWSYILKSGEKGQVITYFDPNAHGPNATGPISRIISVYSTAGLKQVGFSANVTK